jgi:two-component system response regulator YesN
VFVAEEFSIPDSEFQRFEAAALSGALATADHSAVEAYFADLERRFADTEDSEVIRAASIVIGSTCASFMAGKDIGRRRIFPLLAPNAADEEIGSMESLLVTFRDLGRRIVEHLRRGVTRPDDTSAKLLNRVRERITDPNLYLKAIAAELGISSAYAGRLFYEETGLHFSHYLNKRRIALAIERMEAGETSTARLASAVGYADPKYFSRVFKRITGRSPTKYLQTLARPDGEASPRQFG